MFSGQSAIQLTRFAVAAASYVSVRGYLESGAAFLKMMLPVEVLSGFGTNWAGLGNPYTDDKNRVYILHNLQNHPKPFL